MEHRQRHDPSKNLVGFSVGAVQYAVPIARVKEIANPIPVVALPHAPPAVVGVADYRGEVVPVVDLRARFGLAAAAATRKTKWIVVDVVGHLVALVVDSVTEVFGTGGAGLRPPPALGGDDVRGISGCTNYDGALVFVLETARFRDVVEPLAIEGRMGSISPPPSLPPGAAT
jgi:purine-binding chemotaxis protein CheW